MSEDQIKSHEAAVKRMEELTSRSWLEDQGHENGDYFNKCIVCGEQFIGHKRRLVCRSCATDDKIRRSNNALAEDQ